MAGAIAGTDKPFIFQTCRTVKASAAPLTYRIPVLNGKYTVHLGFADLLNTAAGKSLADIGIEGVLVLDDFDAWAAAGGAGMRAVVRSFTVTVSDGELTILVARDAAAPNVAFINNIEIVPSGGGGDTVPSAVRANQTILIFQVHDASGKTVSIEVGGNLAQKNADGTWTATCSLSAGENSIQAILKDDHGEILDTRTLKVTP